MFYLSARPRCYDPMTILIVSGVLMAGDAATGFKYDPMMKSLLGKDKSSGPDAAALPDPNKAAEDAKVAQDRNRRMLLASGGQTNVTGGSAVVLGDNINSLNLAGV